MKSASSLFHPKSQMHAFYAAHDNISGGNDVMLELLFGANPISDDELQTLITKRPNAYGRFAGYLGTR